jgi:hypothetical protein
MTVYNELMAETARRLESPDYFTPVDKAPAHMARSVLNRFNLLRGVRPGSELPIRDVPSALDSVGIEGIVPGELLFGRFAGHDDMKAVPSGSPNLLRLVNSTILTRMKSGTNFSKSFHSTRV